MKQLWLKITNGRTQVSQFLIAYGPFGLFAIAALDSALIPLPAGPDAVMILLAVNSSLPWVLVCAAAATAGSVAGCLFLYLLSHRAGRRALRRFSTAKQERVKQLLDRYDVLALFIVSILPPPFPFKLFVVTAGVFRFSLARFIVAIAAGRASRFLLEGLIVAFYGEKVTGVLTAYSWRIGLTGVVVALTAALIFFARSRWRRKATATGA